MKGLWGRGISLSRDYVEGAWGRTPILGNTKDEVFEMYEKCLLAGLPLSRGPLGETGRGSLGEHLREMNSVSGFLSWTRRSLTF